MFFVKTILTDQIRTKIVNYFVSLKMAKVISPAGFSPSLKSNNFDLLRFILALFVFLVHFYILTGSAYLDILDKVISSDFAVKSFFVMIIL